MSAGMALIHPAGGAGESVRARELSTTTVLLTVTGEVDAATDTRLLDDIECRSHGYHQLVLDLSAVTFFGTAGLRVLHRVDARCARTATDWVVVPGPEAHRLLRICDPDGSIPAAPNIVSAVARLARGPHRTPQLGTAATG